MPKIVINACFGGFSLSEEAYKELGLELDGFGFEYRENDRRTDEELVRVVEKLGDKASGRLAKLKVVQVPDDVEWEIDDYDGYESVEEKHRSWN
jgi:hypothetical protein